jgi:thiol-disulfide isomerase/thioredoxin
MEAVAKKRYTIAEVEAIVAQKGFVAVLFTAPNCQYCGPAKTELDRLVKGKVMQGVVIDAPSSPELAEYASVAAAPTLQLYQDGKFERSATGNRVVKLLKDFA